VAVKISIVFSMTMFCKRLFRTFSLLLILASPEELKTDFLQ
jgi:hypothetical protein